MAEIIELPKPPRMRGIKQSIEELRKGRPRNGFDRNCTEAVNS